MQEDPSVSERLVNGFVEQTMNRKSVPPYILFIGLVCLGAFIDAPIIPQPVKVPCYVGPTPLDITRKPAYYLNETEWKSPSRALFGAGVDVLPNPCAPAP